MRFALPLVLLLGATPAFAQWHQHDPQGHPIPSGPDTAGQGQFGVMEIATTDPDALQKAWAQLTPVAAVSPQNTATRHEPIFSFIIFGGCTAGPDGNCHVTAHFDVRDPDGKQYSHPNEGVVWDSAPPPSGNLQLGKAAMGIRIEAGELLGKYKVIAQTTDHIANITLTTEQTLTITEAHDGK